MNEESDAKGAKEDKENHNNLDSEQNEQGQGEDQDGLDATNGKLNFIFTLNFHQKSTSNSTFSNRRSNGEKAKG